MGKRTTSPAKRDLSGVKLTKDDWARIERVAAQSEQSVDDWLRSAVMATVAGDEAHWEEVARRDAAANAVDRESIRLILNRNGHGTEPSKFALDAIVEKLAVARTEGRSGLALLTRKPDR